MKSMISGIKPTGMITLGNYIGAIKNFIKFQDDFNLMVFVADLHALTTRINPTQLNKWIEETAALYIACGLDPKKVTLFKQSDIKEHANLGYILTCHSYMGELSRMTQYKDKTQKDANDSIGVGLFIYPPLMAADILLYDADFVPVGDDQKQHIEITRDLAIRFNNLYGNTFKVPEPIIPSSGARVMSLSDPLKKMSKSSDIDDKGSIRLLDDLKLVRKKILSAVTDSDNEIKYDLLNKPGISNLIVIYSSLTDKSFSQIEKEFKNKGYGNFKKIVADKVVEVISEIQVKYNKIVSSGEIEKILLSGAQKASLMANKKLDDVYKKVGLKKND